MKKRFFSIILSLSMVLSMLPVTALAVETDVDEAQAEQQQASITGAEVFEGLFAFFQ